MKTVSGLGFTAYAYRADDGSVYVTLINKTYATNAKPISVSLQLPGGLRASGAQRMDLMQKNDDITAQTDITLGGAAIDAQGIWTGHWQAVETGSAPNVTLQVAPASAAIINFLSPK